MFAQQIARRALPAFSKRAFSTTRTQFASPYHYAEGPRSNLPFNTQTRFFAIRFWTFMSVGFGTPIAMAVWQTYKN